jgi:hypothetical protein
VEVEELVILFDIFCPHTVELLSPQNSDSIFLEVGLRLLCEVSCCDEVSVEDW